MGIIEANSSLFCAGTMLKSTEALLFPLLCRHISRMPTRDDCHAFEDIVPTYVTPALCLGMVLGQKCEIVHFLIKAPKLVYM